MQKKKGNGSLGHGENALFGEITLVSNNLLQIDISFRPHTIKIPLK